MWADLTYKEIGRVRFTGVLCLLVLCQGLWSRRVPSNASTPTARRNRDVNSSLGLPLGRHFRRQDGGFQSIGVPLNHPYIIHLNILKWIFHDKSGFSSSISSDFPLKPSGYWGYLYGKTLWRRWESLPGLRSLRSPLKPEELDALAEQAVNPAGTARLGVVHSCVHIA